MKLFRIIRDIVGMFLIAFLFYLLSSVVEEKAILARLVIPVAGVRLDQWLNNFHTLSMIGITMSFVAGIVWYIFGQWIFKVLEHTQSNRFWFWLLLLIFPFTASVLGLAFTYQAQLNSWIAHLFYIINSFGTYYFTTVFFSPVSFKYLVPGSKMLRRW